MEEFNYLGEVLGVASLIHPHEESYDVLTVPYFVVYYFFENVGQKEVLVFDKEKGVDEGDLLFYLVVGWLR